MQEPLVLLHFSFLFHSFSVYKSAHDSGLHLLSYNTVLISGTIIRTFPELPGDKPIHLVLIQILGTDIVLIILIIFVIHTVSAPPAFIIDILKKDPNAKIVPNFLTEHEDFEASQWPALFFFLSIRYLNPVSVFAFCI